LAASITSPRVVDLVSAIDLRLGDRSATPAHASTEYSTRWSRTALLCFSSCERRPRSWSSGRLVASVHWPDAPGDKGDKS
jgi:hypothetical protein